MLIRIVFLCVLFACVSTGNAAERSWPGAPPDCWTEERNIHLGDFADIWKTNTVIRKLNGTKLKPGIHSPNKGYFFVAEDGRPSGVVTIFAEKAYLIRFEFTQLFGLSDVKWVNEKLLFMRPWWGRIAATDLIYESRRKGLSTPKVSQTRTWPSNSFVKVARCTAVSALRRSWSEWSGDEWSGGVVEYWVRILVTLQHFITPIFFTRLWFVRRRRPARGR